MDTVIAKTPDHIVEFSRSPVALLTIARRDGKCVAFTGKRVAGEFRDCVATHGAERAIETYLRLAGDSWSPLYKPSAMERMLA